MENNIHYVYILCYPDTTPFYVGKGKERRYLDHFKKNNLKHNSHKNNVINKIQRNNEKVKIIFAAKNITDAEAIELEIKLIKQYGRIDNNTGILTNLTDGGDGVSNYKHPPEMLKHFSEIRKGKEFSEFHKETIREVWVNYSDEERAERLEKMTTASIKSRKIISDNLSDEERKARFEEKSKRQKGRVISEEGKLNISKGLTGRVCSESTKEKLREINLGRTHTEENKEKIRKAVNAPEVRAKIKEIQKEVWADPILRAKHSIRCKEARLKYLEKKKLQRAVLAGDFDKDK